MFPTVTAQQDLQLLGVFGVLSSWSPFPPSYKTSTIPVEATSTQTAAPSCNKVFGSWLQSGCNRQRTRRHDQAVFSGPVPACWSAAGNAHWVGCCFAFCSTCMLCYIQKNVFACQELRYLSAHQSPTLGCILQCLQFLQVKTATNNKSELICPSACIQSTGRVTPDCSASVVKAYLSNIANQKVSFFPLSGCYIVKKCIHFGNAQRIGE